MVTLAAIGYASGRGLIGLSYGYGYQYCTTPSQYQYCSTSSTSSSTTTGSTSTTGSTTTTTGSTTTTSSSSTSTTTHSTTTTTSSTTTTGSTTTSTTTTTPGPRDCVGPKTEDEDEHEGESVTRLPQTQQPHHQCTVEIDDVSKREGNRGRTKFVFEVELNGRAAATMTVHYSTSDGTATAGSDYQPASGTVTFYAGNRERYITINVLGDRTPEPDETFFVTLSSPSSNLVIGESQGRGTIKNDD